MIYSIFDFDDDELIELMRSEPSYEPHANLLALYNILKQEFTNHISYAENYVQIIHDNEVYHVVPVDDQAICYYYVEKYKYYPICDDQYCAPTIGDVIGSIKTRKYICRG